MVTQEQANNSPQENLGRDIMLNEKFDMRINYNDDLQRITFYDNLKQAIILRLKTALGELEQHPNYGSQLHLLLGSSPTVDTLTLARMYVKDALLQEPRIDQIVKITPTFTDSLKNVIEIQIEIKPISGLQTLNLIYELFIT